MKKPTIILLLILILSGCKKDIKSINIANELRGNTFNMVSISEDDTLTIEFKDSIYSVFDYNDRNLPWGIATFDNTQFLVFEKRIIALK
ncbi:lipoprotein [uncultured Winogradskyella sp.]|uniref:lipoprotein n=1 Tax=uncultured Winogradskyella sp. TaxID=395353 RepID=UPI0030D7EAA2|tara:strand:+ start:72915 stop:73181 length:267 start_codon:yes stop_codon:yes gene_type:complete